MSKRAASRNPFRYGREAEVLVDRERELAQVVRVAEQCGTLFLIGPRRFGKSSILLAADAALTAKDVIVLRFDAEAYEHVGALAKALMTGALRKYSSALERAQALALQFFKALKPSLSYDPNEGRFAVEIGITAKAGDKGVPMLTDVLNGIERLAVTEGQKAFVIIDEFQQIIVEAGEKAERQIRAAVQRHQNVGYVFAGSSTRMMTDMISSSTRAFWQLGDQLHLGPIPRADFIGFLREGFATGGATADDAALVRILDLSEDVPYNVQQLASQCWTLLTDGRRRHLNTALVDEGLEAVVSMQHVGYLQRWLRLTQAQKQTLRMVVTEPVDFVLASVARRYGLPRSTMQRALEALEAEHLLRSDITRTAAVWRLEDPFMGAWLLTLQVS